MKKTVPSKSYFNSCDPGGDHFMHIVHVSDETETDHVPHASSTQIKFCATKQKYIFSLHTLCFCTHMNECSIGLK